VRAWAEACGQARCLIEETDGAAAEAHHVEVRDARLHYHGRTDEAYDVIAGRGTMVLGGEEVDTRSRSPRSSLPASSTSNRGWMRSTALPGLSLRASLTTSLLLSGRLWAWGALAA
jgi:hypothetical protein